LDRAEAGDTPPIDPRDSINIVRQKTKTQKFRAPEHLDQLEIARYSKIPIALSKGIRLLKPDREESVTPKSYRTIGKCVKDDSEDELAQVAGGHLDILAAISESEYRMESDSDDDREVPIAEVEVVTPIHNVSEDGNSRQPEDLVRLLGDLAVTGAGILKLGVLLTLLTHAMTLLWSYCTPYQRKDSSYPHQKIGLDNLFSGMHTKSQTILVLRIIGSLIISTCSCLVCGCKSFRAIIFRNACCCCIQQVCQTYATRWRRLLCLDMVYEARPEEGVPMLHGGAAASACAAGGQLRRGPVQYLHALTLYSVPIIKLALPTSLKCNFYPVHQPRLIPYN
jgi:hypothetical protein